MRSVARSRSNAVRSSTASSRPTRADGIDVEDLALRPGDELRVTDTPDLAGVGRTVTVEAEAFAVSEPRNGFPYSTSPPQDRVSVTPTSATAIPYFQWDNRDGRAMRVWLPVTTGSTP